MIAEILMKFVCNDKFVQKIVEKWKKWIWLPSSKTARSFSWKCVLLIAQRQLSEWIVKVHVSKLLLSLSCNRSRSLHAQFLSEITFVWTKQIFFHFLPAINLSPNTQNTIWSQIQDIKLNKFPVKFNFVQMMMLLIQFKCLYLLSFSVEMQQTWSNSNWWFQNERCILRMPEL